MQTKITVILIAAVIIASLLLNGCWNRREPEFLAVIVAVAFDYDEERELFHVIAQIANPLAMDPAGGASGEDRAFWTVSAYANTPFEAARTITEGSSRELFWGHNRVVLFSESLARHGIREVFDMMERERQFRLIARPAVVQGDIRKLMEAEFPLEETGASGLNRQMVTIQFEESIFHTKFLNELYSAFEAPGQEMFMGKIEVLEDAGQEDEEDENDEENEGEGDGEEDDTVAGGGSGSGNGGTVPPAKLGGGALFEGDRLTGWATVHQSEGWLYAHGRGHRYQLTFECPEHDGGSYISVEVFELLSRIEPVGSGRDVRIKVELAVTGRLQNVFCAHNLDIESQFTHLLRKRSAQVVRNRVKDMVKRSQDLKTDVLGLGNIIYRKNPKLWEEIGSEWDEIFPELEVDVDVEFYLSRTGLVTDPVVEED